MRGIAANPGESAPSLRARLGTAQFVAVVAVLAAFAVVGLIVFSPVDTTSVVLPGYESRFGFRGGRAAVQDDGSVAVELYALASVEAGGPLGLAGFRAGDIPVAHHGGADEFAWALRRSECGEATTITVVQAADWKKWGKGKQLRRVIVPARRRAGAPGCSE